MLYCPDCASFCVKTDNKSSWNGETVRGRLVVFEECQCECVNCKLQFTARRYYCENTWLPVPWDIVTKTNPQRREKALENGPWIVYFVASAITALAVSAVVVAGGTY